MVLGLKLALIHLFPFSDQRHINQLKIKLVNVADMISFLLFTLERRIFPVSQCSPSNSPVPSQSTGGQWQAPVRGYVSQLVEEKRNFAVIV